MDIFKSGEELAVCQRRWPPSSSESKWNEKVTRPEKTVTLNLKSCLLAIDRYACFRGACTSSARWWTGYSHAHSLGSQPVRSLIPHHPAPYVPSPTPTHCRHHVPRPSQQHQHHADALEKVDQKASQEETAGGSKRSEANTPSFPSEIISTGLWKRSICLSALPIVEHRFSLHRQAFQDALNVCYGWEPTRLPSHCTRGAQFNTTHAFSCLREAFNDQIRDVTAQLISEVCSNVEVVCKWCHHWPHCHQTVGQWDRHCRAL